MHNFRNILLSLGLVILSVGLPIHPAYSQAADGKPTELSITDTQVGDGVEALQGDMVKVLYTGWIYDEAAQDHKGKEINTSQDRAKPVNIKLAPGRGMRGLWEGISGMKTGGRRTILIPPNMGYGEMGENKLGIPKTAVLLFEIELIDVKPASY